MPRQRTMRATGPCQMALEERHLERRPWRGEDHSGEHGVLTAVMNSALRGLAQVPRVLVKAGSLLHEIVGPGLTRACFRPVSCGVSSRNPSSLVIRLPGSAARGPGGLLLGVKRPVGPAPPGHERKPPPIFQSILNQSPINPPSFPFPYPVPISKRHSNEQRWKLPSFRQDVKGGAFSLSSSTTHDLWTGGAPATETSAAEGKSSTETSAAEGAPEGAPTGEDRIGGALAARGFEPAVFEALAKVQEIRERQASRFSKGMQCSLSRGYALEPHKGDMDALRFVFGAYMPKQWDPA